MEVPLQLSINEEICPIPDSHADDLNICLFVYISLNFVTTISMLFLGLFRLICKVEVMLPIYGVQHLAPFGPTRSQ